MKKASLLVTAILVSASAAAHDASAQQRVVVSDTAAQRMMRSPDYEAVRRAALDYIEGFYEGDTTKIVRSIRPEVAKYGFDAVKDGDKIKYVGETMTWDQIVGYARMVRMKGRTPEKTWPKDVSVLDVQDQTAVAKVTAWWGIDYLHLAKYDGRWMIVHVLWQSTPPKK